MAKQKKRKGTEQRSNIQTLYGLHNDSYILQGKAYKLRNYVHFLKENVDKGSKRFDISGSAKKITVKDIQNSLKKDRNFVSNGSKTSSVSLEREGKEKKRILNEAEQQKYVGVIIDNYRRKLFDEFLTTIYFSDDTLTEKQKTLIATVKRQVDVGRISKKLSLSFEKKKGLLEDKRMTLTLDTMTEKEILDSIKKSYNIVRNQLKKEDDFSLSRIEFDMLLEEYLHDVIGEIKRKSYRKNKESISLTTMLSKSKKGNIKMENEFAEMVNDYVAGKILKNINTPAVKKQIVNSIIKGKNTSIDMKIVIDYALHNLKIPDMRSQLQNLINEYKPVVATKKKEKVGGAVIKTYKTKPISITLAYVIYKELSMINYNDLLNEMYKQFYIKNANKMNLDLPNGLNSRLLDTILNSATSSEEAKNFKKSIMSAQTKGREVTLTAQIQKNIAMSQLAFVAQRKLDVFNRRRFGLSDVPYTQELISAGEDVGRVVAQNHLQIVIKYRNMK